MRVRHCCCLALTGWLDGLSRCFKNKVNTQSWLRFWVAATVEQLQSIYPARALPTIKLSDLANFLRGFFLSLKQRAVHFLLMIIIKATFTEEMDHSACLPACLPTRPLGRSPSYLTWAKMSMLDLDLEPELQGCHPGFPSGEAKINHLGVSRLKPREAGTFRRRTDDIQHGQEERGMQLGPEQRK